MNLIKTLCFFVLVFLTANLRAQTFIYSYTDPCTGLIKSINVPSNGITVTYFNQIQTFNPNDFQNGVFDTWATGVLNSYGDQNPCGSVLGVSNSVDVAQGTAMNFISIVNSISALSDLQQSMAGPGGSLNTLSSVESAKTSSNKKDKKDGNSSQNNQGSVNGNQNTQSGESNGGSNGSTSQPGESNGGSNGSTSQSGESNGGSNGSTSQSGGSNGGSNSGSTSQSGGSNGGSNSGSTSQSGGSTSQSSETNESTSQSGNSGTNGSTSQGAGQNGESSQTSETTQTSSTETNTETSQPNSQANTQTSQNGSTGGQNGSSNGQSNELPENTQSTEGTEEKRTNTLGGNINSTQKSTERSNEGGKPTIVLSSDFAGFNFKNKDVTFGGKGTAGWTSMRWDGRRSYGVLLDYTSVIKGPNVTTFWANMTKRRIDLISLTGTISFYGRGSQYASLALGQMWSFPKVKNLKTIYMINGSFGNVYGERFLGTAFIGGAMYDWKVSKRIDLKMMNLFIYAPYVSYYNDIVLKSPYVIMPILGTNIGITKKFKFNINFGGAYAIKEDIMNFTLMFGARLAI